VTRWEELFDGWPAFITYRKADYTARADGKLKVNYATQHRAPTADDFERHFRGDVSLGRSPLRKDGKVTFGAIDIDVYQARDEQFEEIASALSDSAGALFRSKSRGLHFFMFSEPVEAADMVDALDYIRSKLPKRYRARAQELFPKQTEAKEGETPTAINLPMFGVEREFLCAYFPGGYAEAKDWVTPQAVGEALLKRCRRTAEEVRALAERNRVRKKGGRPVREAGPVGFREPDKADGRQHFLFLVGSSMRARGADMDQIREQLLELDRHYAEVGHPLWEGKGQIEPKRLESALKSIAKFEQGTPSGLHYSKVAQFNEEFAIIDFDGKIEVLDCRARELKTWPWTDFLKKTANRRMQLGKQAVPIAPLWLADVDRREYAGLVIEPSDYRGPCFNVWPGFAVEPRAGDASVFVRYVEDVLCSGDRGLARWVMHWLADAIQRPTEPSPPTALAIRGAQGQGKTMLFEFMRSIFGRAACEVATCEELFGQFNRYLLGCTIIGAEEAIFTGSAKDAQKLKSFISSPRWSYEEKFRAKISNFKNVHRVIATTNNDHAVLIEDDDRRWTIVAVPKRFNIDTVEGKAAAFEYFKPFYDFMKSDDGPAIILDYLLGIEVDRKLILYAHTNEAKADDKVSSDPVLQWLDDVAETLTLPHDREGAGIASIKSIVEAVRKGSMQARHMSNEAIAKRVRKLVPHATGCRTAIYVERWQLDTLTYAVRYNEERYQRGLSFGTPAEFRAAVARVTMRDYGAKAEGWRAWRIVAGDDEDQDQEERVANTDAHVAQLARRIAAE
jgi:hypothetical protein